MTGPLGDAIDALDRRDHRAALVALLDAWELAATEELVPLIAAVGQAALPPVDPILTTPRASQQRAWMEVAETKDPVAIPWLLGALDGGVSRRQLDMLAAFKPDPRCGAYALEWIPKIMMRGGDKIQRATIALLAHSRHPGAARLLKAFGPDRPVFQHLAQEGLALLAPPSKHRHSEADVARIAAAVTELANQKRTANRTVDELYAAVYADPDSDEKRLVLADALMQGGDPRGELIALQLNPTTAQSKKAATLLKRLAAQISNQVAPLADVVIERGFPVAAIAADERAAPRPEFRTLRRLTVMQEGCAFIAAPELGNVRAIAGTVECLMPALRSGIALPWEEIELGALTPENYGAFVSALPRMPKLRVLLSTSVCREAVAAIGAKGASIAFDMRFDQSAALVEALRQGFAHGWTLTFSCKLASVRGALKQGALTLTVKSSSLPEEQDALLVLLQGQDVTVLLEENVAADDHRWNRFKPRRRNAGE